MAKKQSNDVLWLVDENGRRTFTVSRDAWDALHGDEINRVAAPATAGVLTTMRAQPSVLTTMRAQPSVLTTMRAQPSVLTTMRAQSSLHQ